MASLTRRRRGNRFRVYWTPERIIEAIQDWNEEFGEPPRRTDWDPTRCEVLAEAALRKADDWRRRATRFRIGEYPTPRTITEAFGSWNEAVRQAGLTPREPSQRGRRGVEPSPFLLPLGVAVSDAYDAQAEHDVAALRTALLRIARVARKLAGELDESTEPWPR